MVVFFVYIFITVVIFFSLESRWLSNFYIQTRLEQELLKWIIDTKWQFCQADIFASIVDVAGLLFSLKKLILDI